MVKSIARWLVGHFLLEGDDEQLVALRALAERALPGRRVQVLGFASRRGFWVRDVELRQRVISIDAGPLSYEAIRAALEVLERGTVQA